MTGRYEEPETQREAGSTSPGAAADGPRPEASTEARNPSAASNGPAGHGAPDYGYGPQESNQAPYVEPGTTPNNTPLQPPQMPPQQHYPSSGVQGGQPFPDARPQSGPLYVDPSQSGPQQQPGASGPTPVQGPPGPPPVHGGQSGPNQVPPGGSGPFPAPPGQSGPNQVGGVPSGPYAPAAGPFPQQPGFPPNPQQPNPQQPQGFPPQQPPQGGNQQPFGQDLSSAQLLRQTKRPPQSGWRKALYVASGRSINLGESASDVRRRELIGRINQPLQGCYKIAMLSLKGGVGKTTTTATLGSTFSSLRGDRVIAVDANPDRGTLSQKIPLETTATVRHLLRDAQRIRKYSDVRSYTSQGPSRLEILASEQDPAVSEAFSEDDYQRTVTLLEHFYNILLTDCGTGLMHSAMKGVLDVADSLVIVSPGSIDGARSASATLDWLDAHGYGSLVSRSVAVINSVRPGSGKVDVDKLSAHFGSRCRSVARIPFDAHLEEGAEVELDQLAAPTRLALLELAAIVADDFPQAFGRQQQV